ncbi:MAG: leucine-rich repeat protein [Bacilli bacterium]
MKKIYETILFMIFGIIYIAFCFVLIWYLINLIFFNLNKGLISFLIVLFISSISLIIGFISIKKLTKRFVDYKTKLNQEDKERLFTLFEEVKEKSKKKNVKLLLFNDSKGDFLGSPALALQTSKSYIGLAEDVRVEHDEVIKGLIAHEMYHIISNFNIIYFFINILTMPLSFLFLLLLESYWVLVKALGKKHNTIIYICLYFIYLLTVILLLIVRLPYNILIAPLNRYEERQADKFACSLGYAEGLRYGLYKTTKNSKITIKNIFYWILPIHPLVDNRLSKIYELSKKEYDKEFYIINDELLFIEKEVENLKIPNNVLKVSCSNVLNYNAKVKTIDFNNVRKIKASAFRNIHSLEKITLENVETVEQYAFFNCLNLKEVKISKVLNEIGENAFLNTVLTKNKEISFITLDNWAIACNLKNPKYLEIPNNISNLQNKLFLRFNNLEFVRILNPKFKFKEKDFNFSNLKAIIWENSEIENIKIIKSLDELKIFLLEDLKTIELDDEKIKEFNELSSFQELIDKYYNFIFLSKQ